MKLLLKVYLTVVLGLMVISCPIWPWPPAVASFLINAFAASIVLSFVVIGIPAIWKLIK